MHSLGSRQCARRKTTLAEWMWFGECIFKILYAFFYCILSKVYQMLQFDVFNKRDLSVTAVDREISNEIH